MDSMTPEERDRFISAHVDAILKAYESFHDDISKLSLEERDKYIHSRVVRDLAISEGIGIKLKRYSESRDVTWQILTFVDVLALAAFAGIAVHEAKDILAFIIVGSVMAVSRLVTRNLLKDLHELVNLYEAHGGREANTAALLFLVNAVDLIEEAKHPTGEKPE